MMLAKTMLVSALFIGSLTGGSLAAAHAQSQGLFEAKGVTLNGTPSAFIQSCEKYTNEAERLADCRQKMETYSKALQAKGFTVLQTMDCAIDAGMNRFCSSMDSVPRAIGSIYFAR